MNTVKDIYDFLTQKFPLSLACDFDNPGLLIGDGKNAVTKALIALDCNINTVMLAKKKGCELIITHHPVIFDGLKNILSGSVQYELIKNGISVISMHTNLDVADGGVNDYLCKAIGLFDVTAVTATDGFTLKIGNISPVSSDEFAGLLKTALGGFIKYIGCNREIKRVLVCSGSGGEFLNDAVRLKCDALVTADVKHNVFIDAVNCDTAIFDAGHFNTEDVVVEPLRDLLEANFTDTTFISSHSTEIKYR